MTLAHSTLAPLRLLGAWTFEPLMLTGLAVTAVAYARGALRMRRRGVMQRRYVAAFATGMATLVVALTSPLAALSSMLFSAHMVQHLVLMLVVAPLLVHGRPGMVVMLALPVRFRRALRRVTARQSVRAISAWASHPVVVWLVGASVLWAWHLPSLYQLALVDDRAHAPEHASFLLTAALFWWLVLRRRGPVALARPAAVLLVFATALQSAALGAVLTFASAPLYPVHTLGAATWGLSPLQDQQLAGVIMAGSEAIVFFGVFAAYLLRFFYEEGAA